MKLNWTLSVLFAFIAIFCLSSVFASGTSGANGQQPAMEFFGIGPEMAQDRGVAWCKAIGTVMGEAVSQFGIVALAAIMLYQNLASKAAIKTIKDDAKAAINTVKEDVTARLDKQREAITTVAMAVPSVAANIADGHEAPNIDKLVSPDPIPVVITNPASAPANVTEVHSP